MAVSEVVLVDAVQPIVLSLHNSVKVECSGLAATDIRPIQVHLVHHLGQINFAFFTVCRAIKSIAEALVAADVLVVQLLAVLGERILRFLRITHQFRLKAVIVWQFKIVNQTDQILLIGRLQIILLITWRRIITSSWFP